MRRRGSCSRLRRFSPVYAIDARAEQAEQAALVSSAGSGISWITSRAESAVDAGEDVAVGGGQRDVLEAQQRVAGQAQHPVHVAQREVHHVRVPHRRTASRISSPVGA